MSSFFQVSGDFALSDDGRELLLVSREDAILQSLTNGAQVFKGYWRYDLNKGIPYFDDVIVLGPQVSVIQDVYYRYILDTPGIESVQYVHVRFDSASGELFVDFRARADSGAEISSTFEYALAG